MNNFLNDFENQIHSEAAVIRRKGEAEDAAKQRVENASLERSFRADKAREAAVAERQKTLDWAWAAAELLRETPALPEIWTHETTEKKGFFGRAVIRSSILAEGWPLLDWQNTRYRIPRHTLLLTPGDQGTHGIHLGFFSQEDRSYTTIPPLPLQPITLHPLSRTPLSDEDMPWPPRTNQEDPMDTIRRMAGARIKKARREQPWKEASSITINSYDYIEDEKEYRASRPYITPLDRTFEPKKEDYEEYQRSGIEESIRNAIARLAAKHLVIGPENTAKRIQTRINLGIE